MSKQKLIDSIAEKTGVTKTDIGKVLDSLSDGLLELVKDEGRAVLPGVAILTRKERPARTGRNPQTGAAMTIDAKTVIGFKAVKGFETA